MMKQYSEENQSSVHFISTAELSMMKYNSEMFSRQVEEASGP